MKVITPFLCILILFMSACEEDSIEPIPSDIYTGIFFRTIDGAPQDTSSVTLSLKENVFGGNSSREHYPAIGTGSFVMDDNTIRFKNESPWFANFEWTYILDDTFTVEKRENRFILTKKIGDSIVDTYVLLEN